MKFYDCRTAPSPRRVRMFIAEKGIEIDTVQVDLAHGEQLGDAFRAINPNCTVPVLVLDDGTRLLNTQAICTYLDEVFPEPNLLGESARERALIAMWQNDIELNGLSAVAECLRNSAKGLRNRALTGPIDYAQIPELAERGRQRTRHFLVELDRQLAHSPFVAGERFTIADISAFVCVEFTRMIKEPLPDTAQHLREWRDRIAARPSAAA